MLFVYPFECRMSFVFHMAYWLADRVNNSNFDKHRHLSRSPTPYRNFSSWSHCYFWSLSHRSSSMWVSPYFHLAVFIPTQFAYCFAWVSLLINWFGAKRLRVYPNAGARACLPADILAANSDTTTSKLSVKLADAVVHIMFLFFHV